MAAPVVAVANSTRSTVLGDQIAVAETSLSRMVGLLGKDGLAPGTGLLIYPSQSIHTVAMRFPIDVVFVDRNWRVIYLRPQMVPYRLTGIHWRSRCVIELPSGIIEKTSTRIGDQLLVTEQVDTAPAKIKVSEGRVASAKKPLRSTEPGGIMRHLKRNLLHRNEGQSLIEAAFVIPFLLVLIFNAVNMGYFFFVYLNMVTAPRQGAQYSILGAATTNQTLPSADDVWSLVNNGITGVIPSAANTPGRVCTLSLGAVDSNGLPPCSTYGTALGSFDGLQADPESTAAGGGFVLNRVDIQYTATPIIPGGAFNLVMPSSLTFHRWVYMRAEN